MTTRLQLRTALRRRLGDTSATPLWDDTLLNDLLTAAMRRYGARFPIERAATVTVTAGLKTVATGIDAESDRVVRVIDPAGAVVPRIAQELEDGWSAVAQAWRWWAGSLLLVQPAAGGGWRIEYLAGRDAPADDTTAAEIVPGDEELVILLAAGLALRRRATDEAKRGETREAAASERLAMRHEAVAADLIRERRRHAQGGWMEGWR